MRAIAVTIAAALVVACGGSSGSTDGTDTALVEDTGADAVSDTAVAPDIFVVSDANNQPPDVVRPPQGLGGVCQVDSDCLTGYCNTFPQGGYCTQRCGDGFDACPDNGTCIGTQDSDNARRRLCLKPCIATTQCRLDQWCPPEAKVCTPRCQEGDCGAGYTCNTDGLCVPEAPCVPVAETCDGADQDCDGFIDNGCGPTVSPPSHVRLIDMGTVKVGGSGISRTLSFVPQQGASSFSVVALDADNTTYYLSAYSLDAPGAVDLLSPGPAGSEPNRSSPSFAAYTLLVPNSDQVQLTYGRYSFNFFRYPAVPGQAAPVGNVHVYVLENNRPNPSAGTIDLNLWFVGVPGLSAASAPGDARFTAMMDETRRIFGLAGITIGTLRYFDVTGPDAQRFTIVDTSDEGIDEHAELLALSASLPPDNHGVNLFFVQGFTGWGLLGKAGGIPGPPLFHGTFESGVVVSMDEYLADPDPVYVQLTAETMAHELGHQLGLYHPTEQNGRSFDHILDTPECPAEFYDANGDGLVDPIECEIKGGLNLMFWSSSLHSLLSDAQRRVLNLNPTLRD